MGVWGRGVKVEEREGRVRRKKERTFEGISRECRGIKENTQRKSAHLIPEWPERTLRWQENRL